METKEFASALLDFKGAIQATPQAAEPHYQLALACLAIADPACSVSELRTATEIDPKHMNAKVKLAELMATGKTEEVLRSAQEVLQTALQENPNDTDAIQALATIEIKLGNPEDAMARLVEAFEKAPQDLRIAFSAARMKLAQNDIPGTEAILRKAIAANPTSVTPVLALADLYTTLDRLPAAEQELRQAVKQDPRSGQALTLLGELLFWMKRPEEAEPLFARAAALPDKEFRSSHANFLFWAGRRDQAIQELEKLYREDPKDRDRRMRLSIAYQSQGRNQDSADIWIKALKDNPKDTEALTERARILIANGRANDAERDLTAVLRQEPNSAQGHFLFAKVFELRGLQARQEDELGLALRFDPKLLSARTDLAVILLSKNAARSTLEVLAQAPVEQRTLLPIVVYRSWANLQLGNKLEARRDIDKALEYSRNRNVLLLDAAYWMNERDFAGARNSIKEAMQQSRADIGAVTLLARSYEAQNQPAAAIPEVRVYASQEGASAQIQTFFGKLLLKFGDRPGAVQAFLAALKADAHYAPALVEMGRIEMLEGKLDQAARRMTSALASNPKYIDAYLLLGAIEERKPNYTNAIFAYRKALGLDEKNKMALNNLAYTLAEYGNQPDEALSLAQKAVELSPNEPAVRDTLGWVLYHKGMYSQAVQELLLATRNNSDTGSKFHLGLAYLRSGNANMGNILISQAVASDPSLSNSPAFKSALGGPK